MWKNSVFLVTPLWKLWLSLFPVKPLEILSSRALEFFYFVFKQLFLCFKLVAKFLCSSGGGRGGGQHI